MSHILSKAQIDRQRQQLPIHAYKHEITQSVLINRVTIIAADTGAGKSTQVPQFLLEAGFQRICCTQPRRIACISLAKRVAYENCAMDPSEIAYQIRFEGTHTKSTRVLFLTEGVLLRMFGGDRLLSAYDVVIVDEVHERHAMGDFLLGILKSILIARPTLKLVLMSATINAELFSRYFNQAPLITVPGKTFPVEVEYVPMEEQDINLVDESFILERRRQEFPQSIPARTMKLDPAPYLRIMEGIDSEHPATERGDLLIFLPGINEISALADAIQIYATASRRWIVLKLHSTLSIDEQDRVFDMAPAGVRKCILSTNIAETSVTIDGIRFIIDSGKVKELDFDYSCNLSKLSEFWISQASAKQRTGRAGRTGPGHCYRLYSEREFDNLNAFTVPEILRGPMEQIVLQIKALQLVNDPREFTFIEQPPKLHVEYSVKLLQRLDALDAQEQLTLIGHTLSQLPVDVVVGKMLILGAAFEMIEPVIIVAAGLTVQTPFMRLSNDADSEIIANRHRFDSPHGDPYTLLNMFQEWIGVKYEKQENSRRWCMKHGVEEQRLYEIVKLVEQFRSILVKHLGIQLEDQQIGGKRHRDREAESRLQRMKSQQDESAKGVKILRAFEDFNEDNAYEEGEDIHAVEFSAKHDVESLYLRLYKYRPASLFEKKMNVLKLIVCSGLYPNVAMPDEGNATRRIQDHVYHTKLKRFVVLHPTSIFATNSDFTDAKKRYSSAADSNTTAVNNFFKAAEDGDVDLLNMEEPEHSLKSDKEKEKVTKLSSRYPEVLCFLQILETTKPYLMNLVRVPALQTVLLFGRGIDTNADLSSIVIDDWTILQFKHKNRYTGKSHTISQSVVTSAAAIALNRAVDLRRRWTRLTTRKLVQNSKGFEFDLQSLKKESILVSAAHTSMPIDLVRLYESHMDALREPLCAEDEWLQQTEVQEFMQKLENFLSIDEFLAKQGVIYTVDTLRSDDLSTIFPQPTEEQLSKVVPSVDCVLVEGDYKKYGVAVTDYLRYSTVQYPISIFAGVIEKPSVDEQIKEHSGLRMPSGVQASLGSKTSARRVWECKHCHKAWMATIQEQDQHLATECTILHLKMQETEPIEKKELDVAKKVVETAPVVKVKKVFHCPVCNRDLDLSPVMVLRHKKTCR